MNLTSLLASSSLLALAACSGGGSDLDARWSGADNAHVMRAIEAASGVDGIVTVFFASAFASNAEPSAACPEISQSGSVTTVTGGCTDDSGTVYAGSMTIDNIQPLLGGGNYDPSKPTHIELDNFSLSGGDSTPFAGDGTIDIDQQGMTSALDFTIASLHARSDAQYKIVQGSWTALADATIDVDDVGSAAVTGTWTLPNTDSSGNNSGGAGSITLTGAQTLVLDMASANGGKCFSTTIDGEAGPSICQQ